MESQHRQYVRTYDESEIAIAEAVEEEDDERGL